MNTTPELQIVVLDHAKDLPLPSFATKGSAGFDLRAALGVALIEINPGSRVLIPTGLQFRVPEGYEVQIRPRSGLALNRCVTVLNAPGTIDSDYRGEVCVLMINHGLNDFVVVHGDRIAQAVVARVEQPTMKVVTSLDETERGSGGFGSTGVK